MLKSCLTRARFALTFDHNMTLGATGKRTIQGIAISTFFHK